MKIEYLSLENFVNVYAGLGRKKVVLDFTKSKNNKVLLLGDNGSGKTVLLSSLQPYRETNDNREMALLEGEKKATKIIKIRKGEDLYEITHYYGRSSSGNKSYIKKNGEELNDTGSIRSFLTILEGELNISKDYFVLGRLGDNVSNFIDQSMTDRKKYINKFIPNIDRFLDAFKLSSDRLNSLDRQIKTINVSLERYGDIEENEAHRAKLQTRLRKLEEVKTKLSSDLAVLKSKESNILEKLADYPENLLEEISSLEAEIEANKTYILNNRAIKPENAFDLDFTNKYLDKLQAKSAEVNNEIIKLDSKSSEIEKTIKDDTDKIAKNINLIESMGDSSQDSLEQRKEELTTLLASIEKDLGDLKADSGLLKFIELNNHVNLPKFKETISTLTTYIDHLINTAPTAVTQYLLPDLTDRTAWKKLEEEYTQTSKDVETLKETWKNLKVEYDKINRESGLLEILNHTKEHAEHAKDCPIVAAAIGFKDKAITINDIAAKIDELALTIKEKETRISDISNDLTDLDTFNRNYTAVVTKAYNADKEAFTINIGTGDFLYQPNKLQDSIERTVRTIDRALLLADKETSLVNVKEKLSNVEKSLSNLAIINKLYTENDSLKVEISSAKTKLTEVNETSKALTKKLSTFVLAEDMIRKNRDILIKLPELEHTLEGLKGRQEAFVTYTSDLAEIRTSLATTQPSLEAAETEYKQTKADLDQADKDHYLISDSIDRLNKISAVRATYKVVQDSLDPKKGIPLIFTENYLTSISQSANELLDVAYKGSYQLKFVLGKRDFRIEILKGNGNNLEDINLASQGERSMTSISLSLSMLGKIMHDSGGYNIIYLDEMDAELDVNNRKSFIGVINRQMELLGVEQTFIITHNNEFYSDDVDLILLNGYESKIDITDKSIMEGKSIIYKNY